MLPGIAQFFPELHKDPGAFVIAFVSNGAPTVFTEHIKVYKRILAGGILSVEACVAQRNVVGKRRVQKKKRKEGKKHFPHAYNLGIESTGKACAVLYPPVGIF